jgi:acyl-lipid omega-6 desaturase (Delta-12 desaturase)
VIDVHPAGNQGPASGNSSTVSDKSTQPSARDILASVKAYAVPDSFKGLRQLLVTAVAFFGLWLTMWWSLDVSYWLTLVLAVPTGLFLVRFFLIQHDCGHGSFFRSQRANDMIGRMLSVLTLTPYTYWRRMHAEHHASSGNLDRRGEGDVTTLTVREYIALSRWQRLLYQLYRHPIVLFGIGPAFVFIIKHRFPLDLSIRKTRMWGSVMSTNGAVAAVVVALCFLVGPAELIKLQVPVTLIASAIGVWLFFIQHQFDGVHWWRDDDWSSDHAALYGSSYYNLPKVLQWLTANIGLHHIHHLCSRVPNYRLQECQDQLPELSQAKRVTFMESLRCTRLALWDEAGKQMIRFRDLKRMRALGRSNPA